MTEEFRIRKFANKFNAQIKTSALVSGGALDAVERYRKKHGGIWVGGVVELTHKGVFFSQLSRADSFTVRRISFVKPRVFFVICFV
ncbi:hypothetical protein [Methylophilus sp. 5]|uniref:hypothetical protein n=1 Tax=Methylophilus sp. 5 TaxID=1112274 RepID=UPI0012F7F708|nr:hypothetical protein [Methylophilus sp. 5]